MGSAPAIGRGHGRRARYRRHVPSMTRAMIAGSFRRGRVLRPDSSDGAANLRVMLWCVGQNCNPLDSTSPPPSVDAGRLRELNPPHGVDIRARPNLGLCHPDLEQRVMNPKFVAVSLTYAKSPCTDSVSSLHRAGITDIARYRTLMMGTDWPWRLVAKQASRCSSLTSLAAEPSPSDRVRPIRGPLATRSSCRYAPCYNRSWYTPTRLRFLNSLSRFGR